MSDLNGPIVTPTGSAREVLRLAYGLVCRREVARYIPFSHIIKEQASFSPLGMFGYAGAHVIQSSVGRHALLCGEAVDENIATGICAYPIDLQGDLSVQELERRIRLQADENSRISPLRHLLLMVNDRADFRGRGHNYLEEVNHEATRYQVPDAINPEQRFYQTFHVFLADFIQRTLLESTRK